MEGKPQFAVGSPRFIIRTPQFAVGSPQFIIRTPQWMDGNSGLPSAHCGLWMGNCGLWTANRSVCSGCARQWMGNCGLWTANRSVCSGRARQWMGRADVWRKNPDWIVPGWDICNEQMRTGRSWHRQSPKAFNHTARRCGERVRTRTTRAGQKSLLPRARLTRHRPEEKRIEWWGEDGGRLPRPREPSPIS